MIPVFFIEPTQRARYWLRRHATGPCTATGGGELSYHNAKTPLPDGPAGTTIEDSPLYPHDDPRWPLICQCGYEFKSGDSWQLFHRTIYRRPDTGEFMMLDDAPPGAVWNAFWVTEGKQPGQYMVGPDGRSLIVRLPNGRDWMIDSRASNCTMPNDDVHKCWIRHGRPEDGSLHVDKNGVTCAAGAGSIQAGDYHGFLHNGHLTPC